MFAVLGACFEDSSSSADSANSGSAATDTGTASTDTSGALDDGSGSSGAASPCGNMVIDPDEECDGGEGCDTGCQLVDYTCNPYNQVGCAPTQTCDITRGPALADQRTGCFQDGQAGYLGVCQYDPLDPALQCGDGLNCVGATFIPGCAGAECCTEFCLIGGEPCPDETMQCLTWKEVDMPPGLDELGLCIAL